jgi:hypothetical protein
MKIAFTYFVVLAFFIACASKNSAPDNSDTSNLQPISDLIKSDTTIDFESRNELTIPKGFKATYTGTEQSLEWKVVDDNGNKVVAQLAKNEGDYYNLLVLQDAGCKDFIMSAKIKAVSGQEDQGGGLVWRYIDNKNYYLARYNPLENNVRLYRVVNGNRKQLKSESSDVSSGVWFKLEIEMIGNKISCSVNGIKTIETTDDIFSKSGKVGLWTKADAVTYFDHIIISVQN